MCSTHVRQRFSFLSHVAVSVANKIFLGIFFHADSVGVTLLVVWVGVFGDLILGFFFLRSISGVMLDKSMIESGTSVSGLINVYMGWFVLL